MPQTYTNTFLDITPDDIADFLTLRRWLDEPLAGHRLSIEQVDQLISDHETEIRLHEEKHARLTEERERVEKALEETYQLTRSLHFDSASMRAVSLPRASFHRLRHWRKGPKTLKIFFQALACLFAVSDQQFLTELKVNPSKSSDAHSIALWMSQIEENDRACRAEQEHDEQQRQWQTKINECNQKLCTQKQEMQQIEKRILNLKHALHRTEQHRQAFAGSN